MAPVKTGDRTYRSDLIYSPTLNIVVRLEIDGVSVCVCVFVCMYVCVCVCVCVWVFVFVFVFVFVC